MSTQHISFTSANGYKYIIKFKTEERFLNKIDITTVSFDLHSVKRESLVLRDLISIGEIFKQHLTDNNVILCYVCSNTPITTSRKNKTLAPQVYRSALFDGLFRLMDKHKAFYKKDLIIEDKSGDQHLSFISFKENAKLVDSCTELVSDKLTAN